MNKVIMFKVFLICLLQSVLFAGVNLSELYPTGLRYPDIDSYSKFIEECQFFGNLEEDNSELINGVRYNYLLCNNSTAKGSADFPSSNDIIDKYSNIEAIESRFWYFGNDSIKVMVHNGVETHAAESGINIDGLPDSLLHYSDVDIVLSSGNVKAHFRGELYGQQQVDNDELVITGNMYRVISSDSDDTLEDPSFMIVICIDREKVFGIKDLIENTVIIDDCRHSALKGEYNESTPEF